MKKIIVLLSLFALVMPNIGLAQFFTNNESSDNTVLDSNSNVPYYSFASSRGNEWLIGNSNQLLHVTTNQTYNLTQSLKENRFFSIRKIATDGQGWLILGDSNLGNSDPDLAFLYDGVYFKNISSIFYDIPENEWIGNIAGKQGLWLITTDKSIYLWHNALSELMPLELPPAFKEPRVSDIELTPIATGWLISFNQQNGPKSLAHGYPLFDKRIFFYDGEKVQETTSLYNNISSLSAIGSNGKTAIMIGAVFHEDSLEPEYAYFESNGLNVKKINLPKNSIFSNSLPAHRQPFLTNGKITWTGTGWLLHDNSKTTSFINPSQLTSYHETDFTIINSAYGSNGNAMLVGYKMENNRLSTTHVISTPASSTGQAPRRDPSTNQ